jgi:16S rRNA (guanine(1405)-N(7))-methyltransferase
MAKNHSSFIVSEEFARELTARLLSSRKYRGLDIPTATVMDLIDQASLTATDAKSIEQTVREKLHNLVATYLGDPDYAASGVSLDEAYASHDDAQIKKVCLDILSCHASTRERLPLLDKFFPRLFAHTGQPAAILDLACALNPFALPWMGLRPGTRYYAYDLHQPRLELINHLFELNGMEPLAVHQDILVDPPEVKCDVAFFFKEAHRFEQRQRGCNRAFWQSIQCKYLLVSLPTASLTGKHPKLEQHRKLVMETVEGQPWKVSEIEFSNEIVFCIEK